MRIIIKEKCDEFCFLIEDGKKIHEIVLSAVKEGIVVEIDFAGVTVFSAPFFHSALGDLLEHITYEDFNRLVKIVNLHDSARKLLKRILDDSVNYYSDKQYRTSLDSVLKNLSEDR